jgi:NADPH-dependent curcumin reductase CurA
MTIAPTARSVHLERYALGTQVTEEHFRLRETPARPVADGDVLVETLALSVDPYLRGCMTGLDDYYVPQLALASAVHSLGVARVLESRRPGIEAGDLVVGDIDWADSSVVTAADTAARPVGGGVLRRLPATAAHPSHFLGVLGITGITAFFGVVGTARPQPGETMLISGAAGGVGSVAGQIAKIIGTRVIGLAGTAEKRDILINSLGFDAALDYRRPTLAQDICDLAPRGPDIYFDNVGGAVSQAVMSTMRRPARIIECGQISSYDDPDGGWRIDIRPIHQHGLQLQGFTPSQFREFVPGAVAQLAHWLDAGRLLALETKRYGLESAPAAFVELFRGGNVGKSIVVVNKEDTAA